MKTDKLSLAASKVVLGLLPRESLAEIAVASLEAGCDSPSLRLLAGLTAAESAQAWAMFDRALSELCVNLPSKCEAVRSLAHETAQRIQSGAISAYEGARQIWDLALSAPDEHFPELDPFVYAASEWEDRPEERQFFEKEIESAASELLRYSGPADKQ